MTCCLDPLLETYHSCWPLLLWYFFYRCVHNFYWFKFQRPRHLLTPQYHHHNFIWYLMSRINHIVHSIPLLNFPLVCCLIWYIFLPTQINWHHVPHLPRVTHWWCDSMVVTPIHNRVAIVLGILASIKIASLHPSFHKSCLLTDSWYTLSITDSVTCSTVNCLAWILIPVLGDIKYYDTL